MSDNIVVQYFIKGGWVMWPILITSVVALAVTVERLSLIHISEPTRPY